ncbi:hypothetical protein DRN93_02425 [archaeon]|nr:MAG: hypothetical protein DRN93_02425 [archaeon]
MKESYDLVVTEPEKGLKRLLLASTEEMRAVKIPEFYEGDATAVCRALGIFINKIQALIDWVKEAERVDE